MNEPRIEDMNQGTRLLSAALRSDMPAGLGALVAGALTRARARQERACHIVRMLCTGLSLASFVGLFVSVRNLASAASASGFTSYASLFVSDSGTVFANFASFLQGLAEALPSAETAVFLALVAVFLVTLRSAVAYGMQTRASRTGVRIA